MIIMLLTRIAKGDDNAWKMAKFCCTLASRFLFHREEVAHLMRQNAHNKFGNIFVQGTDFSLQCYIIELIFITNMNLPEKQKIDLATWWPNGPTDLWEKIPHARAANKSFVSYLNHIDKLLGKPYVNCSFHFQTLLTFL